MTLTARIVEVRISMEMFYLPTRMFFYPILLCATGAVLMTLTFCWYFHTFFTFSHHTFQLKPTNFGYLHPFPAEKQWTIPMPHTTQFPLAIIGYKPQLYLRKREGGGYDIVFYDNPGKEGVRYLVNIVEVTSMRSVETDAKGTPVERRYLSPDTATYSEDLSSMARQVASPILHLKGIRATPYAIRIEIIQEDTGIVLVHKEYLVVGTF